jgi:hypothetical protein
MCARTTRWLFTALLGGVISIWAAAPLRVAAQSPASSDEDRLLLGTWKLNLAKSKYRSGPPPQSQTRTYEPEGQGVKATIQTTFADGRSTTVGYVANYNSLEYALTGSPDADTIALKRVAPRSAEATLMHAGRIIATASRVISEDGNILTITYQGVQLGNQVDYIAVYEKQK